MPCFKGIAVSIHANSAPLPEHGMQKQSRLSRISTYIPVPQPELSADSNKPEPAKFAISITLLTPGVAIPYSTPKATDANPHPKPQIVGALQPGSDGERGKYNGMVTPYIPMTNSENETIAAYIYFDGRAKEEVATLLRPGEETWVNSRWVQVPDSEGGGLAEREFLFREVGLEKWLNGLDLQGHDAPEKLEKRRQKFEKRQRKQRAAQEGNAGMDVEQGSSSQSRRDTMRYGADSGTPLEEVMDDSDLSSSDDDEPPEATGQIKVAMFRVLASGEIKKGEYSPQFDAHDGDDDYTDGKQGADVEHTTSFAKPKTLDPKTISTQTVTGIDGPDKPYATFTFFYRGERQLQKAGIIQSARNPQVTPASVKRRSGQLDFSKLGPLKAGGTVGFSTFRDQNTDASHRRKARKKSNGNIADDSDEDEDDDDSTALNKMEDTDDKIDTQKLAPEDARFQGELADGVNRIHLKRAHSADPDTTSTTPEAVLQPVASDSAVNTTMPSATPAGAASKSSAAEVPPEALVGSPLKKARPSIDQGASNDKLSATQSLTAALGSIVGSGPAPGSATTSAPPASESKPKVEDEEEL
ncbi:Beta-lactamase-type transpeptidase fold domain containing protein [Sarocladium implicatum]|nr:Beta-lactamase-type transpeptidase fold domain containing protein [Sarocladium implicatum]